MGNKPRLTGATPRALALYDQALWRLACHRGGVLEAARSAWRESPGFVAARQLEAWVLLCGRDPADAEAAGWAYAAMRGLPMNPRERAHTAAIAAVIDGDTLLACRLLEQALEEDPRDLVALTAGHAFDHLLGNAGSQLARTRHALERWSPGLPGYHAILSMHAFALEESGDYHRAEDVARRALELEPHDIRAHHAVAHVLEMLGRPGEGVHWMAERAGYWNDAAAGATHQWWHLALFHLERDETRQALEIYDRRIGVEPVAISELIDASALLWRLELRGAGLGARWNALADQWAPHAADAFCAFNDVHAMLAFAGARRGDLAARLLAAQPRAAARSGATGEMSRMVGEPACRAIHAFANADYTTAERILRGLPPVASRIGGSHAQRDVLDLTRFAASAMRRAA
jgi:tetratricopeptide (TPR) repeat protein